MADAGHGAPQHILVIGAFPESLLNFRGHLIRALIDQGHRVTVMASPASNDTLSQIEALGAHYVGYPVQRSSMSVSGDLTTVVALWRCLRKLQPNVILAYTVKPVIWGGLAASGLRRTHFFGLITGLGFALEGSGIRRRTLSWIVWRMYRVALSRACGVIFQNEDDREAFIARGIVARDITHRVNGSGVDCKWFSHQEIPLGPPVFLVIARLLGAKGLREFAEAARIVKRSSSECVFRIVGAPESSPDRIDLSEVEAWQRSGSVEYVGAVPDIRRVLSDCHVFVLPSYHEGMPRTVLEAMATGRPILTTDVSGCKETVIEGHNGFLVPKGDAQALAERIEWLLAHRDEWTRMGAASRRMAEERFDVHLVNSDMLRIMGLSVA